MDAFDLRKLMEITDELSAGTRRLQLVSTASGSPMAARALMLGEDTAAAAVARMNLAGTMPAELRADITGLHDELKRRRDAAAALLVEVLPSTVVSSTEEDVREVTNLLAGMHAIIRRFDAMLEEAPA